MPRLQSAVVPTGRAWIAQSVLSFLHHEADSTAPKETGGILLGYWSHDPVAPVVTHAVGPGPRAVHRRSSFIPDYDYHEAQVADVYLRSSGTLTYLGDWHTHPGHPGYLSVKDKEVLRRTALAKEARAPRPVMLILGFGPLWEPIMWSLRRERLLVRSRYVVECWTISTFR